MKKIVVILVVISSLFSCGSDKKKEDNSATTDSPKDAFSLEIEGIYEKDDSLVVFYQTDSYFQYEKPVNVKVVGSPIPQKIILSLPIGIKAENFSIIASTNKLQDQITIKGISVKNQSTLLIDGSNFKFVDYFLPDSSFNWDTKNSRYNLTHTNKYPPSFVGNEKAQSLLIK